ncbi:hypothetical protein [Mycolicibacterium obuense]|uniref:hypothetical protein n=1 Tax=Mycolicibacterium obuense TaxID=1807 RepID=UPI0023F65F78|nr:hypothetical protein [Mycolicibacterium obuense]
MNSKWKVALGSVLAVTAIGGGVFVLVAHNTPAPRTVAGEYPALETTEYAPKVEGWSAKDVADAWDRVRAEVEAETRADRVARGLPAEPTPEETSYTDSLDALVTARLDVVEAGCGWDGGKYNARLHGTNYGWCTVDGANNAQPLTHTREACAVVQGRWTEQSDRFPDMKSAREAVVMVPATDAVHPVTGTCVLTDGSDE